AIMDGTYAFDAAAGKMRWHQSLGMGEYVSFTPMAVAGDVVYLGRTDGGSRGHLLADLGDMAGHPARGGVAGTNLSHPTPSASSPISAGVGNGRNGPFCACWKSSATKASPCGSSSSASHSRGAVGPFFVSSTSSSRKASESGDSSSASH